MKYIYDYCQVDFCTRDVSRSTKDAMYCNFHNRNYEFTGDPLNSDQDSGPEFCTIDGCYSKHLRRGLCRLHYNRLRKTGSAAPKPRATVCSVDGCSREHESKGFCHAHYIRFMKTGSAGSAVINSPSIKPCSIPHCRRKGGLTDSVLCRQHRQLAATYSLSEQRYIEMMSTPCAGCGTLSNLSIDHDHSCCPSRSSCGECVRGTLCISCNLAVGSVRDDITILTNLIKYLS